MSCCDVIVVGESRAGFAAFCGLLELGVNVVLVALATDCGGLDSMVWEQPWPKHVAQALQRCRAQISLVERIELGPGFVEVIDDMGRTLRGRFMVFAPFGNSSWPANDEHLRKFSNKGVSIDVSSDLRYFVQSPVAILGTGSRAAEQALLAANEASEVYILCTTARFAGGRFGNLVGANPKIRVIRGVSAVAPVGDESGRLCAVEFVAGKRSLASTLPVVAIFVVAPLAANFDVVGGEVSLDAALANQTFELAGIAAGIDEHNVDPLEASTRGI